MNQCGQQLDTRWGYRDVDTLAEVVANYSSAGLPLETLWSDIEYMPKRFWTMEMDECECVILGSDSAWDFLVSGPGGSPGTPGSRG